MTDGHIPTVGDPHHPRIEVRSAVVQFNLKTNMYSFKSAEIFLSNEFSIIKFHQHLAKLQ